MIAQPVEVIKEPQPNTWVTSIDIREMSPEVDYLALLGSSPYCTDPYGTKPPDEFAVELPQGRGLYACFLTSDGSSDNGKLVINVAKSSQDKWDSNISVTDICTALGLVEDDLEACVADIKPGGSITALDETYATGGATLIFDFTDGETEIDMGGWFSKRKFTLGEMLNAVAQANTMTTVELNEHVAAVIASWTPTPPPTQTPIPTSTTVPVNTGTPHPASGSNSGTPPEGGGSDGSNSLLAIGMIALLVVAGGTIYLNRFRKD